MWSTKTFLVLAMLLGFLPGRPAEAGFTRIVAEIGVTEDIPVFSFFFLRSRLMPDGTERVYQSFSQNGTNIIGMQEGVSIVDTFAEDVPPGSFYKQYTFFVGAYGGTFNNPDDIGLMPPKRPDTPHTGMITSLPFTPDPGQTFESIWGADEATIVTAYSEMVYGVPGAGASPEEWAAWNDAIRPFIDLIFSKPELLLEWTPSSDYTYSIAGRIVKFSDPTDIGSINGEFTTAFQTIPEPSSMILAAIGTIVPAGLIWSRRRTARA